MAEDAGRTRAATYIDSEFQDQQRNLTLEHQRQEQRLLASHKGQFESFARNRELSEARYLQRMQRIDRAYDRAAQAVEKRHNSIGGRLERLTKAGRDRQEATRQALEDRRLMVDRKATANFRALTERQFQAEQRDRISRARELKQFHQEHSDNRQQHARRHAETRDSRIDDRARTIQRAQAELSLRQELQNINQDGRGRTLSR